MKLTGTQDDRLVIKTDVEAQTLRDRLRSFAPWPCSIEFSNGVSTAEFERAEPFVEDPLADLRMFAEHLPDGISAGQVLDVGCGIGHNSLHLSQQYGATVTGFDPSRRSIEIARALAEVGGTAGVRFQLGDPNRFLSEERFDLILHLHTLEYLRDPFLALRNTVQMLGPGGCLVLEHAIYRDPEGEDTLCRFHPHTGQDQGRPWWSLGPAAVLNMLRSAGCARFDIIHESHQGEHIYRRLLTAYRSVPKPDGSAPGPPPGSEVQA